MQNAFSIDFDEKRCGYFVRGCGFDFFMYFTGGCPGNDIEFIESEEIRMEGDPIVINGKPLAVTIRIPIKSSDGKIGKDGHEVIADAVAKKGVQILETQIFNELQKWWGWRGGTWVQAAPKG